ncbi:MAG: AAA family ATPase, partial [Lachnospiraceae bacterium]
TNIGRKSWVDWMDYAEGVDDELPPLVDLARYKDHPPELPEELIGGILRRGHKMLVSGSSKAGKSFLLMELCIAIAEGTKWLGFPCRKGRVLYVNLEIDPASAVNRFFKIYEALGLQKKHTGDIVIWNLRGHAIPLDQLVPKLTRRVRDQHLDAIVIDPIYKVITGDENNASDMGRFCNQFDRICSETGCATIYCHHHSKGAQGMKKAMDRASGSGVFARDPDAQLDMIQLELTEDLKNLVADNGSTAWRMESSLREFKNIQPVNFWFEYPVHRLDTKGELSDLPAEGTWAAGQMRNPGSKSRENASDEFHAAYQALNMDGSVSVRDMCEYLGVTDKTIYARIQKMGGAYVLRKGKIYQSGDGESAS